MTASIYADHAATTSVKPEVLSAMLPYITEHYGNPSSQHRAGRKARDAVEEARGTIARLIHASPDEIYFTSGGSEADTWAVKGLAHAYRRKGRHGVVSQIEHPAVLESCRSLEQEGFEVSYISPYESGVVSLERMEKEIRRNTAFLSLQYANNETGAIQPVREAALLAKEHGVLFHTDAVQAVGHVPVDVQADGIDLMSISAHKFHGPKGIGALYIRRGVQIESLICGGGQERGKRAGTVPTALIVGMAKALELSCRNLTEDTAVLETFRSILRREIEEKIPDCFYNGSDTNNLPGILNYSFQGLSATALIPYLDSKGIYASSGSACSAGKNEPSHVLLACGRLPELAMGSLRLSLDAENTLEEIQTIGRILPEVIAKIREMNPEYMAGK